MAGIRELPPDEVLVQRLRDGDEETFALVLDSWSDSMIRLAMPFVSTKDSAEEAVQDTWLAVIRGISAFEVFRSSLKTWVYRILNSAQAAHPAYRRSPDQLREVGVLIGSYEPHRPEAGGGADRFRSEEAWELLDPTARWATDESATPGLDRRFSLWREPRHTDAR